MKSPQLLLAFLLALGAVPGARADVQPAQVSAKADGSDASITQDPEWRKRFLGSYGVLSGAEPQLNPTEVELMREVIDLIASQPKAAAARLEKAIGPDTSASLDFVLGNLKFQDGDLDGAAKQYESALAKFPDFRRAHKNLGLLRVQQGDCKAALGHLTKAVELGERDGRNFGLMGYCYIARENYLAAEEAYRNAILQEPDTKDWKLGLARSLLAMEKYQEAVALFGTLIEAEPQDPTLWLLQANAYVGLDELSAAAVNLEAVRVLGKAQTSSLVLLGDIYMKSGAWDLAKDAYLDAIESDAKGTQYKTAYRAADLLLRTHSLKQAQEILASIDRRYGSQLDPSDKLDVLTLKAKLARAQGRDKDAAALLESVVKQDGMRGDALLELASYQYQVGNREKAVFLVERAENLEDFQYQALLQHAQFMVSSKDYAKAAEILRKALRIKSEPRVESFLAKVEQAVRP